jgi:hypothetical protein
MGITNLSNSVQTSYASELNQAIGNSAIICLYSGILPATADSAPNATVLCQFTGASPFGNVYPGSLIANPIGLAIAEYTGQAGFLRISTNANVAVMDLDVGLANSGCSVITTNLQVMTDAPVYLSNITIAVLSEGQTVNYTNTNSNVVVIDEGLY